MEACPTSTWWRRRLLDVARGSAGGPAVATPAMARAAKSVLSPAARGSGLQESEGCSKDGPSKGGRPSAQGLQGRLLQGWPIYRRDEPSASGGQGFVIKVKLTVAVFGPPPAQEHATVESPQSRYQIKSKGKERPSQRCPFKHLTHKWQEKGHLQHT